MNAPKRERKKACLKCRQRKVACDGVYPSCKNCVRNKRYCEYPNESELRRRRPPPDFRKLLSIEFYERFRPSPPLGWRLAEMGELDVAFETFDRAYGLDQTKPQIQYGFIRNWASLRQPSPVLEDAMIAAGMRRFGPLYQQVSYSHMNKAIQTLLVLDHVSVFDNLGIQLLFDPIATWSPKLLNSYRIFAYQSLTKSRASILSLEDGQEAFAMQQLWNATYQIYQQHMVLIQLLTETRCPDPDLDFFIERKSDFVSLGPSQKAYSGLLQILKSIYWLFQKPINSAYLLEHRIIEYQLQDWEDEHPHDGFNQTLFKAVSLHLHTQLFLRDLEQFKLGQGDTMTMCKYFDLAEALLESLEQCNHVVLDYLVCMLCFALLSVQKKHFDPQTKKGAKRQIHQITRHFENNPFFIKIIEEKASEVGFTLR